MKKFCVYLFKNSTLRNVNTHKMWARNRSYCYVKMTRTKYVIVKFLYIFIDVASERVNKTFHKHYLFPIFAFNIPLARGIVCL